MEGIVGISLMKSRLKQQLKKIVQPAIRLLKPSASIPAKPISNNWGAERGTPLGRHFIDEFMKGHQSDVTGVVLEIKNKRYSDSLGHNIERADVLDVDESNGDANIYADLAAADIVPSDSYDCFMVNETLQFVYDLEAAAKHMHRVLKPNGVLLVSVPCTVQHDIELKDVEMWRFTKNSCQKLFGDVFGSEQVSVECYGNFQTCTSALAGVVTEELSAEARQETSKAFVQGICVRAQKRPA